MKNTLYFICALGFLAVLSSCQNSQETESIPDVAGIAVEKVAIRRMEKELLGVTSEGDLKSYLEANPLVSRYIRSFTPATDEQVYKALDRFKQQPYNDTLLADVNKQFSDITYLEQEFEQAFRYLKYYYPEFKQPQVFTMVSGFGTLGFGNDIYISEDFIVIGLDYFIGEKATFYPPEVPNYILKRYTPATIVPNTIIMLSAKYNAYDFKDKTLLADMIFYGKSYYFAKKILPTIPDTLLLGYTRYELSACHQNIAQIWGHFVEYKGENGYGLFYETQEFIKSKYVGERPKTMEIGDECPGRVGRWLALQIVRQYAKQKSDITLAQVMQESDAKRIFEESKFKPKKK